MVGNSRFPIYKDLRLKTSSTYKDSKIVADIGNLRFPSLFLSLGDYSHEFPIFCDQMNMVILP
jgi:hypothetical protein